MHAVLDGKTVFDEGIIPVSEVCRLTGMSRAKVYELVADGRIPSLQVDRLRRIPRAGFRQFLESHTVGQLEVASNG
jgi:excisionase family DNA binding protein